MSKVHREEVDKLTSMNADYPHDDAVPELPPVPDAVNPPPPADNFNWLHFQDDVHPQKAPSVRDPGTLQSGMRRAIEAGHAMGLALVGTCNLTHCLRKHKARSVGWYPTRLVSSRISSSATQAILV